MMLEEWYYYNEARRMDYYNDARRMDYHNDVRRMGLLQRC